MTVAFSQVFSRRTEQAPTIEHDLDEPLLSVDGEPQTTTQPAPDLSVSHRSQPDPSTPPGADLPHPDQPPAAAPSTGSLPVAPTPPSVPVTLPTTGSLPTVQGPQVPAAQVAARMAGYPTVQPPAHRGARSATPPPPPLRTPAPSPAAAAAPDDATELFDQLPGQPVDPAAGSGSPAIAAWWAAQARALGDRLTGLRADVRSGLVSRMPAVADELPAEPRRLSRRRALVGRDGDDGGTRVAAAGGLFSGRKGKLVAQAVVLAVVILGTIGYVTLDKSVTLTVDGKTRQLHSFSGDVAGLLKKQNIAVTQRDLVAPAASSDLGDGDRVVVRYARQLQVTVDGRPATYWTTELTVDDALRALNIRADGAELSASRSQPIGRDGLALTLSTPKSVTLLADGKKQTVVSTAVTVADLLGEQGITVRPLDKLSVLGTATVTDGLTVTLTRIDKRQVTETEKVAYSTTKKSNPKLFKGETKTITEGRNGSRKAVYALLLTDGRVTSKTLVTATVITAPVTKVVEVGTKSKPAPTGGGGSVGGSVASLNWAALAKCESGGNPRAVNPAGYYGLYQFSLSTWHAVGGSGNPIDNSSGEQTYRAQILYKRSGVGQWPHCGPRLFT